MEPLTSTTARRSRRRPALRQAALFAAGLPLGALAGWAVSEWVPASAYAALGWADALALAVALLLLTAGAVLTVAASRRDWLERVLKAPEPLGAADLSDMRLQGVIVLVSAGLLVVPPVSAAAGHPAPGLTYGLMLPLLAANALLNLRLWHRADEMMRRVVVETGALCFWSLQFALFAYAGAERLGLVPSLTAWQAVSILMAVYLLVSAWISTRRGLS